jgi:hypothetical protein
MDPSSIDELEKTRPDFAPPRVGDFPEGVFKSKDAFQQGFRDALKEIEREALWQSSEKGRYTMFV